MSTYQGYQRYSPDRFDDGLSADSFEDPAAAV